MTEIQKKKRVFLSVEQKMKIVDELQKGITAKVLSQEYGVSHDVIHRIRRECRSLTTFGIRGGHVLQHKNRRRSSNEELENRLYFWFLQQRAMENPITNSLLLKKAREICNEFGGTSHAGSRGWLWNFKHRYAIRLDHAHSEKEIINEKDDGMAMETGEDGNEKEEAEEEEEKEDEKEEKHDVTEPIQKTEAIILEKKKKDLIALENIIKEYANNNRATIMIGETLKKILANEPPQIEEIYP